MLEDLVAVALLVEGERVLEARAAAATDGDAQAGLGSSAWPFMSSLTLLAALSVRVTIEPPLIVSVPGASLP